eukprot:3752792-Pyramimonas_sp.AAC.1
MASSSSPPPRSHGICNSVSSARHGPSCALAAIRFRPRVLSLVVRRSRLSSSAPSGPSAYVRTCSRWLFSSVCSAAQ